MADGSLSQFKAALARKKARKDKNKGKFDRKKLGFKSSKEEQEFDFPELSEEELEVVKKNIRKKLKFQKRMEFAAFILLLFLGLLFLLYINWRIPKTKITPVWQSYSNHYPRASNPNHRQNNK